jgi:nucleotide-binding universal stress UspA family protein
MGFKDLLVHLDNDPRCEARLALATGLAQRCGAHLVGTYVVDIPPTEFFFGTELAYTGSAPVHLMEQIRRDALAAAASTEVAFRDRLRREGVEGEWRLVEGNLPATVALHARYADLAIVGQPNPNEPRDDRYRDGAIVETVMTSGRPVLAVPYAGDFPVMGERVLVAWNASREAARAINDALPLLAQAKTVTVLAVNPRFGVRGHGDVPAADVALHLARHGVKAEAAHTASGDIADSQALLSYAADISADLIVAGAYGHSRAREVIFGGMTRTLLREMTVPVLFSH